MRAITVLPGTPNSACLDDISEPPLADGSVLVRTLALGVCGTDNEIVAGAYGAAPAGQQRLVLGHESLGVVESAPRDSGLAAGDVVVGIVRRPDPVPCSACAVGEWDMCRNGRYTERGIKERHGFGAERFRIEPEFAVKIDPTLGVLGVLVEPASILAKAWDQVDRIGRRAAGWQPRSLLVTGGGTIGLLAALFGAARGLQVHVFDRATAGIKPELVCQLGAKYHAGDAAALAKLAPDIVMECTGASPVVADILGISAPTGIVCLVGVTAAGGRSEFDIGGFNRKLVLGNDVVFGTVNANRAHYQAAAAALAAANRDWLARLITRRFPLAGWQDALQPRHGEIKTIIDFTR